MASADVEPAYPFPAYERASTNYTTSPLLQVKYYSLLNGLSATPTKTTYVLLPRRKKYKKTAPQLS